MIGPCLHPSQDATVFGVDEKAATNTLNRKDRILPLSPGRAERLGFEYFRHRTMSPSAAGPAK